MARKRPRPAGDRSALRASGPDEVWAIDFQHDMTADGRPLRLVNVVDEFTREALAIRVARSLNADDTVAELEQIVAHRGRAPRFLRADTGPELTSHALADWCRFSTAETAFIEPGAPWQNPFVESFHSRVRDELLNIEQFACLTEARVVIGDWREDYNTRRPHSALGMQTPPRSPPPGPRPSPRRRDPRGRAARPLLPSSAPLTDSHREWTEDRGPATVSRR